MAKAMFGAGCFWGVESAFRRIPGVSEAICGYAGGQTSSPTYEQVCSGRTGHAEVVEVEYDPAQVSYGDLLNAFWEMHDPTTMNRQGPDIGTQYRSAIYCYDDEQLEAAKAAKEKLNAANTFGRPVVTQVEKAGTFWRAEEYHQRYFERRGIDPTCH